MKISIKLSFMEIAFFSLSAFSSSEVPGKKEFYPTLARLSREKREESVKKTSFASKAT